MDEFLADLREGDDSDLHTDDDEAQSAEEEKILQTYRGAGEAAQRLPELPATLSRVLGSEAAPELMAVAKILDPEREKDLTLVFHTPIGDVRTPVKWCSHRPATIDDERGLLLVMVRSSDSTFSPDPGVEMDISFDTYHARLRVTCLARPMRLYPGVGVDLLCFLPQVSSMEKNGKLIDTAPSVVSGKPSDAVDAAGEPIVEGEKSASAKLKIPLLEEEKEDFDKAREG